MEHEGERPTVPSLHQPVEDSVGPGELVVEDQGTGYRG